MTTERIENSNVATKKDNPSVNLRIRDLEREIEELRAKLATKAPKAETRVSATVKVIRSLEIEKSISKADLLRTADDVYAKAGGKSNPAEAAYGYRVVVATLEATGDVRVGANGEVTRIK